MTSIISREEITRIGSTNYFVPPELKNFVDRKKGELKEYKIIGAQIVDGETGRIWFFENQNLNCRLFPLSDVCSMG